MRWLLGLGGGGSGCVLQRRVLGVDRPRWGLSVIPSPLRGGMECCDIVVSTGTCAGGSAGKLLLAANWRPGRHGHHPACTSVTTCNGAEVRG